MQTQLTRSDEANEQDFLPVRFVTDCHTLKIMNDVGLGRILGKPEEDYCCKHLIQLLTDKSKSSLLHHLSPLTADFEPVCIKLEFKTDKGAIPITWTVRPLLERGWKVLAYEWTHCDIASAEAMDFKQLTDLVPVIILRMNTRLEFTYVNGKARETFRKTNAQIIGKTLLELGLDTKIWSNFKAISTKLIETGKPAEFTFKIPSISNKAYQYRMLVKMNPEFDAAGKVYSIVGVANDIGPLLTAHEALEYKDQLLSLLASLTTKMMGDREIFQTLPTIFENVGKSVAADKIFLYENAFDSSGNAITLNKVAWFASDNNTKEEQLLAKNIPLARIVNYSPNDIKEGQCIAMTINQIRTPDYRDFLIQMRVKSFLLLPVFVKQLHWGFLVIGDCTIERSWTDDEKYFFKIFTSSVSAAIAKQQHEQKLIESESRFRQLSDMTPVMIWVSDEQDRNTYVNQTWKDFTGCQDIHDVSYSWESRVHPQDLAVVEEYRQQFSERMPLQQEYRLRTSTGAYRWVIDHCIPRISPNGSFLGYIGVILDVHEKKSSQLALLEQQQKVKEYTERISGILESISDSFIAVDPTLQVFLWNTVMERKTGILARQAIGRNLTELFPTIDHEILVVINRSLSSNSTQSFESYNTIVGKWEEMTVFPSMQGLFIYFKDISQRKKQESLLALEKDVLELNAKPQFSLVGLAYHILDRLQGILCEFSFSIVSFSDDKKQASLLAAVGLPAYYREIVEKWKFSEEGGIWSLPFSEGKVELVRDFANKGLSAKYKKLMIELCFTSAEAYPVFDSHGDLIAVFCIYSSKPFFSDSLLQNSFERVANLFRVLLEHKYSERALLLSHERYELATKASNDAIWDSDMEAGTIYWSEGFRKLFGHEPGIKKIEEQRWEQLIHPDDFDRVVNGFQQFTNEKPDDLLWVVEYRFKKADGNFALVSDRAFPVYDNQGKLVRIVGSIQDITEKREMENRLFTEKMQHQRMLAQVVLDTQEKERELIGRELHDNVNQILSTSKLYLEVSAQEESKREEFVKMGIKNINDAINEVRSISRTLVPVALGDLGLIASIKDLVDSIRKTKMFEISFSYPKLVERVLTEPQKLTVFRIIQEQINNIQKHAAAKSAKVELSLSKDNLQIMIQDDGKGFDCRAAKTSGLGLINIKSRAELFNGSMQLQSVEGEGCKLLIQIPIQNN